MQFGLQKVEQLDLELSPVLARRDRFDRDPKAFHAEYAPEQKKLRKAISHAKTCLGDVATPDAALERPAQPIVNPRATAANPLEAHR